MDWKKILPILLGFILSLAFFFYALTFLDKGDHRPTGVFNNEYNGSGILGDF